MGLPGGSALIKRLEFEIKELDTAFPAYGPNGRDCDNFGLRVDTVMFDQRFSCDCNGTGHIGENCELSASASGSMNSTAQVVSISVAVVLLVALVVSVTLAAYVRKRTFE